MSDFDGALDRWHASKLEEVWTVDEEESDDGDERKQEYCEDEDER
jgi:hypothetical protein